ncbi:MAG TPA: lysophospholipid acyltransferase family protein [Ktedonobacteraceae bacterium]
MYFFFRCAAWLVPHLPRWFSNVLPDIIGPLAWLLATRARRQARRNALHVLGTETQSTATGRRKLRRVTRGMFRQNVSNYLDALLMPFIKQQDILDQVIIANAICLEEALALGKGVILFTPHFGPFERTSPWFSTHGYHVTIPVERLKDERMLNLMLKLRNSGGATYVPLGGSTPLRTIIQALRQNQMVLFTTDRAVEGESVVVDFFGAPARLPIGPVHLSLRTGAPLVSAFGWYTARNKIGGSFSHLTLALSEEERQRPEAVEAALIKSMEQVISKHPEQWMVFAPIWLEPEGAEAL